MLQRRAVAESPGRAVGRLPDPQLNLGENGMTHWNWFLCVGALLLAACSGTGDPHGDTQGDSDVLAGCFAEDSPGPLNWIPIPGGTFLMGCGAGDAKCHETSQPQHAVTISSFEMLETEVTEAQFLAISGRNPSCNKEGAAGPNHPVECVTWEWAAEFCVAVGGRLPTEAEWEYAARSGVSPVSSCEGVERCSETPPPYSVVPSGAKQCVKAMARNGYGLFGVLGNVKEWTADWYDADYYSVSPASDPKGPDSGEWRAVRGGGCMVHLPPVPESSAYRSILVFGRGIGYHPSYVYDCVGFRCVRDASN